MNRIALCLAALAVATGCAAAQQPAQPAAHTAPSLVVLITVDQLRGDFIGRYSGQFTGGLARLSRGGAWFTNAHHDHAIAETAPGHATLLAGRFPRSTGISANRHGVEDPDAPLLGPALDSGASPFRFKGTTLMDWLISARPGSRALSVSDKDRGAILPIGRSKQQVFWNARGSRFTTSRYYADTLPDWVRQFNARRLPESYAGKAWTLLLDESAYAERDSVPEEGRRGTGFTFPHRIPEDPEIAASAVRNTPYMDDILVAFALAGVTATGVGSGPGTDILAISLSATDRVGHSFGPDSRELHDMMLRLDRALGVLVDSLYRLRDSSRVVFVLTGDHGVAPIPELAPDTLGQKPQRVSVFEAFMATRAEVEAGRGDPFSIALDKEMFLMNRNAFSRSRVNADRIADSFRKRALAVPGVRRVDRARDIARADTIGDEIARRWAHHLVPDEFTELVVTLMPYSIWNTSNSASHGSPYDYDTHVPIIFYGPGVAPGRHAGFVRTVDIAPTLAALTGVKPLERLDGVVLTEVTTMRP